MTDQRRTQTRKSTAAAKWHAANPCLASAQNVHMPVGPPETAELLRVAVQAGGIGVFVTDFKRRRTYFSPELCTILGLPVGASMPYEEAWKVIDETDRATMRAHVEATDKHAGNVEWSGVYRIRRPDGVVRWVSLHGRRVYRDGIDGPKPARSAGAVVDVTRFKETEDALRENELRLRLALEAAQMGTFETDLAGTQVVIDAQEARLLGLPEDMRVASTEQLRQRVPLEDLSASDVQKEPLTERREAHRHEFRLSMPDGTERWLSGHADVRSNRIFGVNFDITDRKRAEARLQDSEERLRVATSSAKLGVFEWNAETDHVIWENQRIYAIFGRMPADGPLGLRQFIDEYLHPDDAALFHAALRDARVPGSYFHSTVRIRRNDGAQRWVQIDGKFRVDEPSLLVGVVADATERKELEHRAKELSDCLVTIQEDERQRIAQELHDSTAQHLVAASLNLAHLRPKGTLDSDQTKTWDETAASLEEAMKEVRIFSYLMHPPSLERSGLYPTLQQYVAGYSNRTGIDVKLRLNRIIDQLPFEMQRALLRIVQEALLNVHRHAAASRAAVDVRRIAERLHLIVRDNGRGGERDRSAFGPGRGIAGMGARAEQYEGQLRIRTGSRGTTIHVVMPMRAAPNGAREAVPDAQTAYAHTLALNEQVQRSLQEISAVLDDIKAGLRKHHQLQKVGS